MPGVRGRIFRCAQFVCTDRGSDIRPGMYVCTERKNAFSSPSMPMPTPLRRQCRRPRARAPGARHDDPMSPDAARYAHPERERRFLLAEVPAAATDPREIVDRYLAGTRMRLRSVSAPAQATVYKLGHKVRPDPTDPGLVLHTSFYLSPGEYEVLAALPGDELRKTRRRVVAECGSPMSVDEFHDALEGLVTAEVDLGAPDLLDATFRVPGYCVAEVTDDERFTGGRLAATDRATLQQLLELVRTPTSRRRG